MEETNKTYWPIEKLYNWDKNPRAVKEEDFSRLKKQIKELGEYKPLLITGMGEVLGGNMRLRAYKDLGYTRCWVSIVNPKTEEAKLKYALSDNDQVGYYVDEELQEILITTEAEIKNFDDYKISFGKQVGLDELIKNISPDDADESEALNYKTEFQVVVDCKDEDQQEEVYNLLNQKGYTCKVISL